MKVCYCAHVFNIEENHPCKFFEYNKTFYNNEKTKGMKYGICLNEKYKRKILELNIKNNEVINCQYLEKL